ncbi:MAG TPA: Na+/H+ antiporter subunit E [Solirubrobacter sp.]|nr:Na+/H+ antiporter subunit E [Solirubrobacter sp.]
MPAPDDERHGSPDRRAVARAWLAWWVLCAAVWLALIDRTAFAELMTGVVAAAIGATAAVLVRQQRRTLMRPRARWVAAGWKPLLGLGRDLPALARALVVRGILRRDERGELLELPFAIVADEPRSLAFRVLTATYGSLSPNTIVLDIDERERVLHAHQLVPGEDADALPLGPRP